MLPNTEGGLRFLTCHTKNIERTGDIGERGRNHDVSCDITYGWAQNMSTIVFLKSICK